MWTLFKKKVNSGSNSSATTESTQPGGTAGSQPDGASGSQPDGASGSQPGGASGSQPGGPSGSQVNKKTKMQRFKSFFKKKDNSGSSSLTTTENTEPGGTSGSQSGGASVSQPNGASGSQPGGASGSQDNPGSNSLTTTENTQPGGTAGSQSGGASGSQTAGASSSQGGGASNSQDNPGSSSLTTTENTQPGGASGSQDNPGSSSSTTTDITQPGGASGSQPGRASDSEDNPGSSSLTTTENTQPGGTAGSQSGGASDSQTGTSSQTRLKEDNSGDSTDGHSHNVKTSVEESGTIDYSSQIYEILCQHFPGLKKTTESRFPGDSYLKTLKLRKEDFGKIQQSFSEVHRVKELLDLGQSVCKVIVGNFSGTGFVLFDNFILTNAHLFKDCIEGKSLKKGIRVFALFNYEAPEPYTNYQCFQITQSYICYKEDELDYAVLKLSPEGHMISSPLMIPNQVKIEVPPGLLKHIGPLPLTGEACIIGHPNGDVKKIDPTYIIEKERRKQGVDDHVPLEKDNLFIVCSISHLIKKQGIEKILMGGERADKVATYNTFMYHGSSGSPVFDAQCRVFGLHTGGFVYGFPNHKVSVMEFAQPLLTIFEHFVSKLKEGGDEQLLTKVKEAAAGNSDLENVLKSVLGLKESKHEMPSISKLLEYHQG